MTKLNATSRNALICLALVLGTLAVYWPVFFAGFLTVDDHAYVTDNPVVQQGITARGLAWAFSAPRVANYHPVTWLSHMLDCQLFGIDSSWHHGVNLLIHCLNAVLLYLVLRSMTGRNRCSAVVACLFAIHPVHVESVAWVSERKDVLSALFFLLMLAAWTSYVRVSRKRYYAAALVLFALGLLSKPMLVTVPAVLLLIDIWPMGRTKWVAAESLRTDDDPRTRSIRFLIIEKLPFFALSTASSIATMIAQSAGGAMATTEQIPLSLRIGNALVSYVRYARNFIWPAHLSAFYPLLRPWPLAGVIAAAIGLIAITAALLRMSRRRPHLGFGWLWFLGTLVPVIGLVQVGNQAMADRYMYVPLIGLAIIVAWTGAELIPQLGRRQCAALTAVTLMSLAAISAQEVRWWNNSEALFARSIEQTEPNVFALHNLGSALLQRGQTQPAIACFQQCVALQPSNPHVRRAYGFALKEARRYDDAIEQLQLAVRLDPKEARTWNTLGHVYADQRKWDAAADHFAAAVELNSDDFDSRVNLAVAHRANNQPQHAAAALQEALRLNANDAKVWYMQGALLLENDQPAAAVEPLHRAISLDPRLADAQYRLGLALMASGRGAQSVAPLMAAVQLSPNSPEPLARLAWVLATYPDAKLRRGSDALFLAERAAALSKSSPQIMAALAAALAEQSQFAEATKTATEAAQLAEAAGDTNLASRLQTTAAEYRSGHATRDTSLAGAEIGDALP